MKDNLIEEIKQLCKKYDVRLYVNCYEDVLVWDGYEDKCIIDIIDCEKI